METKKLLEKLLTPKQIANQLGISIFTVYRWIKAGKIKAIKLTPRVFRIEEKELKRFLKRHETK